MKAADLTPLSGYTLERHYTVKVAYEIEGPDSWDALPEKRTPKLFWDWRPHPGGGELDVYLRVTVAATQDAPETIEVALVGHFIMGSKPSVPIEAFIRVNAPAILVPYAREIVSSLSARGPFGTYYMPSINVVRMGEKYDFAKSTGARVLTENSSLAQAFGFSRPEALPSAEETV